MTLTVSLGPITRRILAGRLTRSQCRPFQRTTIGVDSPVTFPVALPTAHASAAATAATLCRSMFSPDIEMVAPTRQPVGVVACAAASPVADTSMAAELASNMVRRNRMVVAIAASWVYCGMTRTLRTAARRRTRENHTYCVGPTPPRPETGPNPLRYVRSQFGVEALLRPVAYTTVGMGYWQGRALR